jgi:hypothetical protein
MLCNVYGTLLAFLLVGFILAMFFLPASAPKQERN